MTGKAQRRAQAPGSPAVRRAPAPAVRRAGWSALEPAVAYELLRLRAEVFVVEQRCAYLDPDGRDLDPAALHYWCTVGGEVAACLRVLAEPEGARRIGRVATRAPFRGHGLAAALVGAAVADWGGHPLVLDAQSHLANWYERFGFRRCGKDFTEDGIPHTPMRRS